MIDAGAVVGTDRPVLRRGVRLVFDEVRGSHALLYPEGTLLLNETAGAVLSRCDGDTEVATIIADLSVLYHGVRAEQVGDLLARLRAKRLIEARGV